MTDLRAAAQQALEALENCTSEHGHRCNRCDSEVDEGGRVAAALRAALEEPQNCAECSRWQRAVLEQGEVIEQLKSELGQSDPTPKPLNGLSQEQAKAWFEEVSKPLPKPMQQWPSKQWQPGRREWRSLSEEEIEDLRDDRYFRFARAIEAALKEKNHD